MFPLKSLLALGVFATAVCKAAVPNPKRGLVYVESPDPEVNEIWLQPGSPLTWYYNYMFNVSSAFATVAQRDVEFVPMYWGAGDVNDTSFLANITSLIKSGLKISHVLGFNQPDLAWSDGGSNLAPKDAARLWINNFLPLQEKGIRIGLPVVNAQREPGNWTVPFLNNCTQILRKESGNDKTTCPYDFVPIHAFGNMSVLTGRIEKFSKALNNSPIWVTEYAADHEDLATTQAFFNASIQYLDDSDLVERYSYFGAFRADVSNVGSNAAMLDPYNRLTDIGSWYIGGNATGNTPTYDGSPDQSGSGSGTGSGSGGGSTCTVEHPCGGQDKSAAGRGREVSYGAATLLVLLSLSQVI